MRNRVALLGLVLTLGLLCFGSARADNPPAFLERELWNQDVTTAASVFTNSLTPLTRNTVSTPTYTSTTYRFTIALRSGYPDSVIKLEVFKSGGTPASQTFDLNGGTALVNGRAYTFSFNASSGFTYNFRVGTNTTIGYLSFDRNEAQ